MLKKIAILTIGFGCLILFSGCTSKTGTSNTNTKSSDTGTTGTSSGEVTDRTDYVIFYQGSMPEAMGGIATHEYIIGRPEAEAGTLKYNAYFVPWKIYFSQVQRTTLPTFSSACTNLKEQVVYIEGWIDLNLADMEINASNLPNDGPAKPTGTVHETVTGEPGTWKCASDIMTSSMNQGSVQNIKNVSGMHTANFSDASNLTGLTVSGATIYLDLSMPGDIQFIWPAGTKIEYAPEGTPVPLEPLAPSKL
jgi:hypothetical protein